jgi:molybdopterin-guanine dinucleotide biosynthesis protein A
MLDLVIVAGGRATRLGGLDKPALVFEGRPLLLRAVDAGIAVGARHTVVVGYEGTVELPTDVWRAREEPRWAGPAAALVAGLRRLGSAVDDDADSPHLIAVLAGDTLRPQTALAALLHEVQPLLADDSDLDGALAVSASGQRHPLLSVFRASRLISAAGEFGAATDLSVRSILASLTLAEVVMNDEALQDIDTADDASRAGIALPDSFGESVSGPESVR